MKYLKKKGRHMKKAFILFLLIGISMATLFAETELDRLSEEMIEEILEKLPEGIEMLQYKGVIREDTLIQFSDLICIKLKKAAAIEGIQITDTEAEIHIQGEFVPLGKGGNLSLTLFRAGTVLSVIDRTIEDLSGFEASFLPGDRVYSIEEENNTLSQAFEISVGENYSFYLYEEDTDWFSFSISQLTVVSIETRGELDTLMSLRDSLGNDLFNDDDGGSGGNARVVADLVEGTYFLEVTGYDESEEGPYSLSVQTLVEDTYESDDSFATAKIIEVGEVQERSLTSSEDRDFVKFELESDAVVDLETMSNFDNFLTIYDAQGAELLNDDDSGEGSNARIYAVFKAGTYFASVSPYGSESGAYSLKLEAQLDVNIEEISVGSSEILTISDEPTIFRLESPQLEGENRIKIYTSGSNDTVLLIHSESFEQVFYNDDGIEDSNASITFKPTSDVFYILVQGYDATEQGRVRLSVEEIEYTIDGYEENNSASLAREIEIGSYELSLLPSEDQDWFYFIALSNGMQIETFGELDTQLFLYDENLELIAEDDDSGSSGGNAKLRAQLTPDQKYFIQVTGYDESIIGPYILELLELELSIDDFEPDDSFENATEIQINGDHQLRNFSSANDRDIVYFELTSRQRIKIETYGTNDTKLILLDASQDYLYEDDDSGDGYNAQIIENLPAGRYFVIILPYDEEDENGYTINVQTVE
jgi:hypothetical protein